MPALLAMRSRLDHWWVFVVRGLLVIAFGLLTLLWPAITVLVLIALFATFCVLDGVTSIISAVQRKDWGWQFFGGILSIVVGFLAIMWPASAGFALIILIAAWAIMRGVLDISAAISLRRELNKQLEWMLIISGIVSILFGLLVALWPVAGILAIIGMIAGFSVFLGVTLIAAGLRQRSLRTKIGPTVAAT
jgi:uncharacterized membrane protein HdeD (DUF308 family)